MLKHTVFEPGNLLWVPKRIALESHFTVGGFEEGMAKLERTVHALERINLEPG